MKLRRAFHRAADRPDHMPSSIEIEGFHNAAFDGDLDGVKGFVHKYPDYINVQKYGNGSVLHTAAHNGKLDLVEFLLQQPNIDLNSRDGMNKTPEDRARQRYDTLGFSVSDFQASPAEKHFLNVIETLQAFRPEQKNPATGPNIGVRKDR